MSAVIFYLISIAKSGKVWATALGGVLTYLASIGLPDPYAGYVTSALAVLTLLGLYHAPRVIGVKDTPAGETGDGA